MDSEVDWVEKFSEEKGRKYWKNRITKETTWKCPFEVEETRASRSSSITPFSGDIRVQVSSPQKPSTKKCIKASDNASTSDWVEKYSTEKEKKYWKNSVTKETTWKDPTVISKKKSVDAKRKLSPTKSSQLSDESGWIEKYDKNKQRVYWKNQTTGETTWKDPAENEIEAISLKRSGSSGTNASSAADGTGGEWVEKFDKQHNRPYWKNKVSKETTWKDPFGQLSEIRSNARSPNENRNNNFVSGIDGWVEKFDKKRQKPYWKNYGTGETTWRDPITVENPKETVSDGDNDEWVEKFDKKRQKPYWKNYESGETSWRDPTLLVEPTRENISVLDRGRSRDSGMGSEWVEKFDKKRQKPYWKNVGSGETSWCDPKETDAANETKSSRKTDSGCDDFWVEKFSAKKNRVFWKNTVTGETTWKDPTGSEAVPDSSDQWIESYDKEEKRLFWKNKKTFEVVFDDPTDGFVIDSPGKPPRHADDTSPSPIKGSIVGTYDKESDGSSSSDDESFEQPATRKSHSRDSRRTVSDGLSARDAKFLKDKHAALEIKYDALKKSYDLLNDEVVRLRTIIQSNANSTLSSTMCNEDNASPPLNLQSTKRIQDSKVIPEAEETERPASFRMSIKALSSLSSSTKSLLKDEDGKQDADEDDDVMDDDMMRRRKMSARMSTSTSNSRRSSSGIQLDFSTTRRRTSSDSNEAFNPSSKKSPIILSVYEGGTGREHDVTRLYYRGDKSKEELINEAKEHSLEEYGRNYFDLKVKKSTLFGKAAEPMTSDKMLCWASDAIKKPMCTLSSNDLNSDAVQLFKNLTSFMGDRSSSKAPVEHVLKVLTQLKDAPNELQDEFYCQIAKQTHQNPSPTSTEKGWQMMMICLATFPPSDVLLPGLMAYCVKQLNSTVPNVKNYAELVLYRARKSKDLGARKEVPTMMEIEALKRGGTVKMKIYFCDKKFLYCQVDSWTTFGNLREAMSKALYLREENESLFDFYEVNEFKRTERVPDHSERVLDVLAHWGHLLVAESSSHNSAINDAFFIEYKKVSPFPFESQFDEDDTSMVELLYVEFVADVVKHTVYPFCSEQDGVTLAALQLQEIFGDYPSDSSENVQKMKSYVKENLCNFISGNIIEQSSSTEDELTTYICLLYDKLQGYSQFESQMSYLQFVRSWSVQDESEDNEDGEAAYMEKDNAVEDIVEVTARGQSKKEPSEEFENEYVAMPYRNISVSQEVLEPLNAIAESEDDDDDDAEYDKKGEGSIDEVNDEGDENEGMSGLKSQGVVKNAFSPPLPEVESMTVLHTTNPTADTCDVHDMNSNSHFDITPKLRGGPPAGPPPPNAKRVIPTPPSSIAHPEVEGNVTPDVIGHGAPPSVSVSVPLIRGGPPAGPPPPNAKRVAAVPTPPDLASGNNAPRPPFLASIAGGANLRKAPIPTNGDESSGQPKPDFLASIAAGGNVLKKTTPTGGTGGGGNPKPDFLASIAAGGNTLKKTTPTGGTGGGGNPKPDFLASIAAGGNALKKTTPAGGTGGGGNPKPDFLASIAAGGNALKKTPPAGGTGGGGNPKPDFLASIAAGGNALKKTPPAGGTGGGGNPKPDFLASIAAGGAALKKSSPAGGSGSGGGNPKPDFLSSIAAGGAALRKTTPGGGGTGGSGGGGNPKPDFLASIAAGGAALRKTNPGGDVNSAAPKPPAPPPPKNDLFAAVLARRIE